MKCENCRFFHRKSTEAGECWFNPPSCMVAMIPRNKIIEAKGPTEPELAIRPYWPITKADWECGQFQPRLQ